MRELVTTIAIDAPPERVWEVLTDFDSYSEWNPFMRVVGRANEGARLAVELHPPEGRGAAFRPTVTRADYGREFGWLGHLGVPGLFDGEHRFVLEPTAGGEGTTFTHAETFRGVLSGLVFRMLGEDTEAGFQQMNDALKTRAETPPPDISHRWSDESAF